jgi:hypothetical protein
MASKSGWNMLEIKRQLKRVWCNKLVLILCEYSIAARKMYNIKKDTWSFICIMCPIFHVLCQAKPRRSFQKFCVWLSCNNKIQDNNTTDIPKLYPLLNSITSTVHTLFPSAAVALFSSLLRWCKGALTAALKLSSDSNCLPWKCYSTSANNQ